MATYSIMFVGEAFMEREEEDKVTIIEEGNLTIIKEGNYHIIEEGNYHRKR